MLLIVCFLVIANFSYFNLQASTPFVKVVLKNGETKKLEYSSFTFNWILPIRLTNQESCDKIEITKDQLDEVFIVDELYNECDGKDDWEVMVYLKDKSEVLGFFIVSQPVVKGKLYKTGEETSIPFKDIKKVKFKK
jgi:hypothetical protein